MKRKFLILSVLAILIAILAANTLAYFTADTKAHNVITSGGVDIVLNEWANEDRTEPFEDRTGVMPGTKVTKIVEISNTGTAPVWVRARKKSCGIPVCVVGRVSLKVKSADSMTVSVEVTCENSALYSVRSVLHRNRIPRERTVGKLFVNGNII